MFHENQPRVIVKKPLRALYCLRVFAVRANFLTVIPPWMQQMTKDILTTKRSARQSRNQRIRSIHHGGHRGHREQKDSFENFSSIYFSLCLFLCVLRALCGASSESFRKPHKFAAIVVRRPRRVPDILLMNFVLFGSFVVKSAFSFFGRGSAVPCL
jgi:hypothetical protein